LLGLPGIIPIGEDRGTIDSNVVLALGSPPTVGEVSWRKSWGEERRGSEAPPGLRSPPGPPPWGRLISEASTSIFGAEVVSGQGRGVGGQAGARDPKGSR